MTENLHEDDARGVRAQALLDDDLLKEAFAKLKADYLNFWENTQATATDARERIFVAYNIIGKVETHLKTIISDGHLARVQLNRDLAPKTKRAA